MEFPIQQGRIFLSWEEMKNIIEDWSIASQFSFDVPVKDRTRADYRCRDRGRGGCSWRVYSSLNREGEIQVKIILPRHTCVGGENGQNRVANTQAWLRRVVPEHLFVTRETKTREIVESMLMHYGVQVNEQAARITRSFLIKDRLDHQRQQYMKVPSYLALLHSRHPLLHTALHTTDDNCFQRVFVCPLQSQSSFIQMRKFVALDGTFLKARFVQTLLLAVGIDANNNVLILAWAVVESENKSSWVWFLNNLKQAIPQVMVATVISDRDKGLLAAEEVLGANVTRLICCFHLKSNFCKRYGRVVGHFWPIANSKTMAQFNAHMDELRAVYPAAADYLSEIELSSWVTAFYTGPYYGQKTSNIVESMNRVLKGDRELSILDLLNEIWSYTMEQRFKRATQANGLLERGEQLHTDYCMQKLQESKQWSLKNEVRMASPTRGIVMQANQKTYAVDLLLRTCTCGHFQANGIPCGHAYSCIKSVGQRPRDHVPNFFTLAIWRDTYLENLTPITLEELVENPNNVQCAPPVRERAHMGRPQRVRQNPGGQRKRIARAQAILNNEAAPADHGRGSQSCRRCGEYGHNKRSCNVELDFY